MSYFNTANDMRHSDASKRLAGWIQKKTTSKSLKDKEFKFWKDLLNLAILERNYKVPKGGVIGKKHGIEKKANAYRDFIRQWELDHAD